MKPKQTRITKKVIEGRLTGTFVIDIVVMQNERLVEGNYYAH